MTSYYDVYFFFYGRCSIIASESTQSRFEWPINWFSLTRKKWRGLYAYPMGKHSFTHLQVNGRRVGLFGITKRKMGKARPTFLFGVCCSFCLWIKKKFFFFKKKNFFEGRQRKADFEGKFFFHNHSIFWSNFSPVFFLPAAEKKKEEILWISFECRLWFKGLFSECGFGSRLGDLPHSLGVGHSTLDQKPSNIWMSNHGVA